MKKKTFWIIQIVLLAVAAYFFLININVFFKDDYQIAINNTDNINKFVIYSDTAKITVEKSADKWISNKIYSADKQVINKLFRLFKNLEISILPPKDSVKFYRKALKQNGNRIEFYKSEKLVAKYWVANYNASKKATLLMNDAENPVYAKALGLSADIAQYVVTNELLWRNKQIFAFEINKMASLTFENHKDNALSFTIAKNNENEYVVKNNTNKKINAKAEKIARYLSYFKNIKFKNIAKNINRQSLNSLKTTNTLYTITFHIAGYGNFKIDLISKPLNDSKDVDINYIYGLVNNKMPLLNISYFEIDPIIKEISYFK